MTEQEQCICCGNKAELGASSICCSCEAEERYATKSFAELSDEEIAQIYEELQ